MQTFLPYPDFAASACALDPVRCRNQRTEAWAILRLLRNTAPDFHSRWVVVPLWRGYEQALCEYGMICCLECQRRGYHDQMFEKFYKVYHKHQPAARPWWLGNTAFHRSHQSNLIRKNPEYYAALWPDVPDNLPYYWPKRHMRSILEFTT